MGVADLLESVDDTTLIALLVALVMMGVAATSLEFTADMMGGADAVDDEMILLIGVSERVELVEGEGTLVTGAVEVLTMNSDATLVFAGIVVMASVVGKMSAAELKIEEVVVVILVVGVATLVVIEVMGARFVRVEIGEATVTVKLGGATVTVVDTGGATFKVEMGVAAVTAVDMGGATVAVEMGGAVVTAVDMGGATVEMGGAAVIAVDMGGATVAVKMGGAASIGDDIVTR